MNRIEIEIGTRFGRLVYIGGEQKLKIRCKCDCGKEGWFDKYSVLHGTSKSCGCLRRDTNLTHGLLSERSHLYNSWSNMTQRCTNPKHPSYRIYGGRGITVCLDWLDCSKFAEWAKANGYKPGLSIDRIDNNRGYYPANCRWATRKEQQRNLSFNRNVEYHGRTMCVGAWAEELGIDYRTLLNRLDRWKDVERAFTEPIHKKGVAK